MPSLPLLASLSAVPLSALPTISLRALPRPPVGFLLRASAGARARSAAPVAEVWGVLAHPDRWWEFDPFLRSVEPADGDADPDSFELAAGQQLLAEVRLARRQIPVEVDHVVNRSSLATTSQLARWLAEDVEHLLIPQASGGTLVTVRITLHGPLALPALLPRWVFRSLSVRLLARAAESGLRQRSAEITSVA